MGKRLRRTDGPAIPLPDTDPTEAHRSVYPKTCARTFSAALLNSPKPDTAQMHPPVKWVNRWTCCHNGIRPHKENEQTTRNPVDEAPRHHHISDRKEPYRKEYDVDDPTNES